MRIASCCLLWILGGLLAIANPPGLSVGADGTLLRQGRPYRGVGVNYYDAFVRSLAEPRRMDCDDGFRELSRRGIPFVRFAAGGYWPVDWGLYQTNRTEHFARLDRVVSSAERHGLGLIPSLFWHTATVPDLVGEPCSAWGDTNSRTHAFLRTYTREVVARYGGSPAVWAWEFGNEYNLAADLPNAAEHRPPVVPALGTPSTRSAADDLTHAQVRIALRAFAEEVRRLDPNRLILSGNAFPRISAWHQATERSWGRDTPEQFARMLAADHPSPVDSLTVRAYDATNDVGRLTAAMAVARVERKPLFVGEFGVPGVDTPSNREAFQALLQALEASGAPLAALWVYDFADQAAEWSVTPTNGRRWQLESLQRLNARWRRGGQP